MLAVREAENLLKAEHVEAFYPHGNAAEGGEQFFSPDGGEVDA